MIYKPDGFELYEVLPKEFYNSNIKIYHDTLWYMFDSKVLYTLQRLRKKYGSIIINNWKWGGSLQLCGWRPFDTITGSYLSQHKFGRAFDCHFKNTTAEEVREDLKKNYTTDSTYQYITCIEENISWFHFDTRAWYDGKPLIVYP